MRETHGNIWDLAKPGDAICITTNGTIKKSGECVMGRGIASEIKSRCPGIAALLGNKITMEGNLPFYLLSDFGIDIYSFPVKHNWWERADLELIRKSAKVLNGTIGDIEDYGTVWLPRPGCGNGQLLWEDVKPVIDWLDDKFVAVTW